MPFNASALSPAVVDTCGGNIVTITGTFDITDTYLVGTAMTDLGATQLANLSRRRAHVIATPDGLPAAYSATAGNGNYCKSLDGTTIRFASPSAPPGNMRIRVTEVSTGNAADLNATLSVQAPFISSFTFTLRTTLPLNYATGPRSVAALPAPDATAKVDI